MLVTKAKYNRDTKKLRSEVKNLQLIVDALEPKVREKAIQRAERAKENYSLSNFDLEYEELPIDNPLLYIKPKPPRGEYDERLKTAIEMFLARKNISQVEKALDVSRKTARKYLRIAIQKRKIKKSDYAELNQ